MLVGSLIIAVRGCVFDWGSLYREHNLLWAKMDGRRVVKTIHKGIKFITSLHHDGYLLRAFGYFLMRNDAYEVSLCWLVR
jgi:hypothetical protein